MCQVLASVYIHKSCNSQVLGFYVATIKLFGNSDSRAVLRRSSAQKARRFILKHIIPIFHSTKLIATKLITGKLRRRDCYTSWNVIS